MEVINFGCLLTIVISGLIFNTIAILSICMKHTRLTLKDEVTLGLCVSNLIQLLLAYTIELDATYTGDFNELTCVMESFLICFCTYAAIAHFVLLSVERYISIVTPYRAERLFRKCWVKFLFLSLGWVYGLIFALPPLFGWNSYTKTRPDSIYCSLSFHDKSYETKIYFYILVIFNFILPLILMLTFFVRIITELKKATRRAVHRSGRSSVVSRCSQKNVVGQGITLLLIVMLYMLSWVPYVIVCFLFYYDIPVSRLTEYLTVYLVKSSTTSSPIVFCLLEKQFWNFMYEMRGDKFKMSRGILIRWKDGVAHI